ncbi:MAG: hypothetical protein R6V56_07840, partial [Lentisphaeria bacterium]
NGVYIPEYMRLPSTAGRAQAHAQQLYDKGGVKRKICKVSCIGCRKCVKEAKEGQMYMEGFTARVNYDNPPGAELAEVCPTGCLQPSLLIKNTMPALQDSKTGAEKQEEPANA